MMRFFVLIAIYVCIAAVDGRREHKRSADSEYDRESRYDVDHKMMMRDENHSKKRMYPDERNFDVFKKTTDDRMDLNAAYGKDTRERTPWGSKKFEDESRLNDKHSGKLDIEDFRKHDNGKWGQLTMNDARQMKEEIGLNTEKLSALLKEMPNSEHMVEKIKEKIEKEKQMLEKIHNHSTK
ncbi:uncharacterized protein [Montipora capricornis]|uniref:uncharacterized protein n=1 Tax=Montipora foliosa TaxID=591990 RepID=UPI0035F1E23D